MKIEQCISCGSKRSRVCSSADGFKEIFGNREFVQEAYSIRQCHECGLYFKDHVISPELLNDYYNAFDFTAWQPSGKYPTEELVDAFLSGKTNLRVLDYGCSEGRYLSKFTGIHQCYGFDIDERALKLAAEKKINVIQEAEFDKYKDHFDVIILSDVFEHSMAPTALLKKLFSMLSANGELIIMTGYADAPAAAYDLANFWYFKTIQHVCMMGDAYIHFIQRTLQVKSLKKTYCSHYNSSLGKRLFYGTRFGLFRFVNSNRRNPLVRFLSLVPYVKKVTGWKVLPYHPYSKDHVVLFLQR
ncbi:MAG: class I SAM-dependent methyltransferase [Ferruginibacter sp.]